MNITAVRVKKLDVKDEKLKAYCTITIDAQFVISDIKLIEGTQGFFIAMPSRRITDKCAKCGGKNHLRAKFCNDCGAALGAERVPKDPAGRAKLHVDVAHPIHPDCRERIQKAIVDAYMSDGNAPGAGDEEPGDEISP